MSRAYLALPRVSVAAASLLLAFGLSGCRGKDISFDCENQHLEFNKKAQAELEPLRTEIPTKGPFPVAVEISGVGLNKLLANIIDDGVPFSGTVPFALTQYGPAEAEFQPTSVPELRLTSTPGCKDCVLFHLDFGVQLDAPEMPVSSGVGFVDLLIPIRLDVDPVAGQSTLVAEYAKATIAPDGPECSCENPQGCGFYLLVYGFDSCEHTMIAGALKRFMNEEIAAGYDDVELLTIGGWEIGDGKIELLAEDFEIQPANDKIVLGMHTNLPLAAGVGVDTSQPLPEGSVLNISMDPRIMLPMAHRMLEEGHIARTYDEEGKPDPQGIYGVTLTDVVANPADLSQFDTTFQIWRTGEGYCGYVVAEMPLAVSDMPPALGIVVTPGEAKLVEGKGSGAAAVEEDELVDENQGLIDRFRNDLAAQLQDTMNFSAIELENNTIVFSSQGSVLTHTALTTYLDFIVVADE